MEIPMDMMATVIPTMTLVWVIPFIEIPQIGMTCIQGTGLTMTTMQTTHLKIMPIFVTPYIMTIDIKFILMIQGIIENHQCQEGQKTTENPLFHVILEIIGNLRFQGILEITESPLFQGILGITESPLFQGILGIIESPLFQGIQETTENPLFPEIRDMGVPQRTGSTICHSMIHKGTTIQMIVTPATHRTKGLTQDLQRIGMEMNSLHLVITMISPTGSMRDFHQFTVTLLLMIPSSSRWWCRGVTHPPLHRISMVRTSLLFTGRSQMLSNWNKWYAKISIDTDYYFEILLYINAKIIDYLCLVFLLPLFLVSLHLTDFCHSQEIMIIYCSLSVVLYRFFWFVSVFFLCDKLLFRSLFWW